MSNAIEKETVEETVDQVEEVIERQYTLRDLKDKDLFKLLQILKKIGVKDFKEAFFQVASGEKTIKEIGIFTAFDMADVLIGNLGKAEAEIYGLWADISGIPAEEIKEMEFGTLPMMIVDTFAKAKNTSFLKVLSKLLS